MQIRREPRPRGRRAERTRLKRNAVHRALRKTLYVRPKRLGHEWADRMQHAENRIERRRKHRLLRRIRAHRRLDALEIPVAEVAPNEVVERLCNAVELVLRDGRAVCARREFESREHPTIKQRQRRWLRRGIGLREIRQSESRRVPQLVREVSPEIKARACIACQWNLRGRRRNTRRSTEARHHLLRSIFR